MFEWEAQKGSRGRDEKYEGECHTTASICPGYKTEGSSCPDLTIREASMCSVQYVGSRGWEGYAAFSLSFPLKLVRLSGRTKYILWNYIKQNTGCGAVFSRNSIKTYCPGSILEQLYTLYIEQLQDKLLIIVHQSSIN